MAVEERVQEEETSAPERGVKTATIVDAETLRQEIAERAYYRYCERGCASGCDVDDWLAGEQEVLAAHAKPAARTAEGSPGDPGKRRGRSQR